MASILDRYGIKEVADVTFYKINDSTGLPSYPVLYLDTLKVSTIEQTAENTEARGGKGNAALISWDYNKEINVTLEDALFSAKSMAIMFGNGYVKNYTGNGSYIMKTELVHAGADWVNTYEAPDGKKYNKINIKFYDATGNYLGTDATSTIISGGKALQTCFETYDLEAEGSVIEISANSFPGTYYVTGDTYARSDTSGTDEFFQFIIPKAKVTSENTITLEAEGDPSVFNMNLRVLRPLDGKMMKLVKYNLEDGTPVSEDESVYLPHNHSLITGANDRNFTLSLSGTGSKTITAHRIGFVGFAPEGIVSVTLPTEGTGTGEFEYDEDTGWADGAVTTYTAVAVGETTATVVGRRGEYLATYHITVTA